jgi:hypothetical protein
MGLFAALPYLSIYLFHSMGIPYLLQNNGASGLGVVCTYNIRLGFSVLLLADGYVDSGNEHC